MPVQAVLTYITDMHLSSTSQQRSFEDTLAQKSQEKIGKKSQDIDANAQDLLLL